MPRLPAKWVIAAADGIRYSTDGTTWEDGRGSRLNASAVPFSVAYDGSGTWVAISEEGYIAWSDGGRRWIDASGEFGGVGGGGYYQLGIAFGKDEANAPLFVVVGRPDDNNNTILYSPDGKLWSPATGPFDVSGGGGYYGGGVAFGTDATGSPLWVAVGYGEESDILTSQNGKDWTPTVVGGGGFYGYDVTFGYDPLGSPLWVAIGYSTTLWSSDGITWNTSYGKPFGNSVGGGGGGYGVAYNGSLWVAVGYESDSNTIRYSPDGRTWYIANGESFYTEGYGVAYDTSGWIAVGDDDDGVNGDNILYSLDGINWTTGSNIGTFGYGIASTQPPILSPPPPPSFSWVIAADNGLYCSTDGNVWSHGLGSLLNDSQDPAKVAYDGSGTWVAIGISGNLAWSTNGFQWSDASGSLGGNEPQQYRKYGIAHGLDASNNPLFVAVGGRNANGHAILYSFNGKKWYDASGDMDGPDYYAGVAFGTDASGNNLWVSVGNGPISTIKTSRDGKTWKNTHICGEDYPLGGSSVAFGYDPLGSPLWVATGKRNTLWSSDGFTWNTSFGNPFNDWDGHCVAYNGSLWVAVGGTPNPIRYSPDGRTWYNADGSSFPVSSGGASVAYKNNEWIAVGFDYDYDHNILRSEDGINWTSGPTIGRNGYGIASTQPPPLPLTDPISLVLAAGDGVYYSTNGTLWSHGLGSQLNGGGGMYSATVAYGNGTWVAISAFGNIAWSPNGVQWTDASGALGDYDWYISYGVAHGKDACNNPLFVAVGWHDDNYTTILYSPDGKTWYPATGSFDDGGGGYYGSSVAFGTDATGSPLWVAVGDGAESNILTSQNGIDWAPTDVSIGGGGVYGVAFGYDPLGAPLWVTTGDEDTLWSSDGQTWNTSYGKPFRQGGGGGYDIAYNGSMWVAVGYVNDTTSKKIRYSPDGRTWYDAEGADFSTEGQGVAYNNGWIAVGDDDDGNNILYSPDGIVWESMSYNPFEGNGEVYGIASTQPPAPQPPKTTVSWVMAAQSGLLYSTDGTTWKPAGGIRLGSDSSGFPTNVAYDGSGTWVAIGASASNGNTIVRSTDGVIWEETDGDQLGTYTGGEESFTSTLFSINGVAYGMGVWYAVGGNDAGYNRVYSLDGGRTWIDHHDDNVALFTGIAFGTDQSGNSIFVGVGVSSDPSSSGVGIISPSIGNTYEIDTGFPTDVAFGKDNSGAPLWVVVSSDFSGGAPSNFYYSSDAQTWTNANVPMPSGTIVEVGGVVISSIYTSVYYNGSIWVAVGAGRGTLWSHDGKTWNNTSGAQFNRLGMAVAYLDNSWIAVGMDSSGHNVLYSNDGITWDASGGQISEYETMEFSFADIRNPAFAIASTRYTPLHSVSRVIATVEGMYFSSNGTSWSRSGGNSDYATIAYGSGTWVAIKTDGNIVYSPDGSYWTYANGALGNFITRYGVAYGQDASNNPLFVAVGPYIPEVNHTILYSTNGKDWDPATGSFNSLGGEGFGSAVAFGTDATGSPLWVAVGRGTVTDIMTSHNGKDWDTTVVGSNTLSGQGIAFGYDPLGAPLWVATGEENTLWSLNGSDWNASYGNPFGLLGSGYGVAYNGSLWVAVGSDDASGNTIRYSPNGRKWFNASGTRFVHSGRSVTYDSGWIAVGVDDAPNNILYSDDGINWAPGPTIGANGNGIATTQPPLAPPPNTQVAWVLAGANGLYYSTNGTTWNIGVGSLLNDTSQYYPAKVAYGEPDGGIWVAINNRGQLASSSDGLLWNNATGALGGGGDYYTYGIAHGQDEVGASLFVAVGKSVTDDTMLYSNTGTEWTGATSGSFGGGGSYGSSVAFGTDANGSRLWVATGYGTTSDIMTSVNGRDWSPTSVGSGSLIGYGVAFGYDLLGSPLWVVTGQNNTLWSSDGSTWNTSYGTPFGFNVNGGGGGYGVAYNGSMWVAVGNNDDNSNTRTIRYSSDGRTWYGASGAVFGLIGTSIAGDSSGWIAVGEDDISGNNILYSSDGMNWTTGSQIGVIGYGITSAQTPLRPSVISTAPWVIAAESGLLYSTTGTSWYNGTGSLLNGPDQSPAKVAYGEPDGGLWVAVNNQGNLAWSENGFQWSNATGLLGDGEYNNYGVAYGHDNVGEPLFVAVGKSTDGATILYSSDGKDWEPAGGSFDVDNSTDGYYGSSVAFGKDASGSPLWVAVGFGIQSDIMRSVDGYTWTDVSDSRVARGALYGRGVAFGYDSNKSPIWVTTGDYNTLWSSDGIIWNESSGNPFGPDGNGGSGIAYTRSLWVAVGSDSNTIRYSPDGRTWYNASGTVFGNFGTSVAYSNDRWIAIGSDTRGNNILYSPDGIQWSAGSELDATGYCIASIYPSQPPPLDITASWVIAGRNGLYYSTDRISWDRGQGSVLNGGGGQYPAEIAYDGSTWVAVGKGRLAWSANGSDWADADGAFNSSDNFDRYGIGNGRDASNNSLFVAVGRDWDGNTIKYSYDGQTWSNASGSFGSGRYGASVAFGTDASGSPLWIAVGNGSSSDIKSSVDGITWTDVEGGTLFGGGDLKGRGVAFGYSPLGFPMWVTTGFYNTLWSSDGSTWNTSYGNPFGPDGDGYGIAYNGSMWVAVGSGAARIRYSLDGTYWENANGSFEIRGHSVAYDTSGWIAVGNDDNVPTGNNILYSPDGINWAPEPGSQIGAIGYGIASTQPPPVQKSTTLFVIATDDGMYYSMGGTTWERGTGSLLNGGGGDYCIKVAYGNRTWVANDNDGNLAWSPTGYNWSDATGKLGGGGWYGSNGIAYGEDGSGNPLFVAVGPPNETHTILYSPDGKEWEPADGTFYGEGDGEGRCVAFGTDQSGIKLWVASGLGNPSDIMTSRNGREWFPTDIGSDTLRGQGIAFGYDPLGAPLWVIVGWLNTLWSSDGSTWNPSYGHPFGIDVGGGGGYGVAYNGSLWVAVGEVSGDSKSIRYSPDGRTWYNADGEFFNYYGYGVAYDTSGWVAVGDDDDGNNILYSPDGINWATGPGSIIGTIVYGIASTQPPPLPPTDPISWVIAAGNGLYYSTDGTLWGHGLGSQLNGGGGGGIYSATVAYGNGTWVAISAFGNIAWSPNGVQWTDASGALGGSEWYIPYGVAHGKDACNNPLFVAVGDADDNYTTILYSPDGKTWYPATGSFDGGGGGYYGCAVAFGTDATGSPLWVAVGDGEESNILTSQNGIDWAPTDVSIGGGGVYGVAFGYDPLGAPLWVTTGDDNTLWSSDGQTWNTSYGKPFGQGGGGGYDIAYNGSMWVAVGYGSSKTIRYSPDGRTWYYASGVFYDYGHSVAYNNGWIAVGDDDDGPIGNNILYSPDGINWAPGPGSNIGTYGYGIASTQPPLPQTKPVSWAIAANDGLYYSTDGISWGHGLGSVMNNGGEQYPAKVAYNGTTWVAINTQGQIARSLNGVEWNDASGSLGIDGTFYNYGIANGMDASNNPLFVAVGKIKNGSTILYSSDGNTWFPATSGSFGSGDNYGSSVAFGTDATGSPLWVAVGYGNMSDILISHNGKAWINVSSQTDPLVGRGKLYGYGVAFGYDPTGSPLWVATGFSNTLWSSDGQIWNTSYGSPFGIGGGGGYGVAYNGYLWVAVGRNTSNDNRNSIRYSPDGREWYDASGDRFFIKGTSVAFDSSGWIAVGDDDEPESVRYSPDGINWSVASGFDSYGYGIASTSPPAPQPPLTTVSWVIAGGDGMYYSTDRIVWNHGGGSLLGGGDQYPTKVAYDGTSTWVAINNQGNLAWSTDGVLWKNASGSSLASSEESLGVAYGQDASNNSLFVAVGGTKNGNAILYSPDGKTWTGATGSFNGGYGGGVAFGTDASGSPLWVAVGAGNVSDIKTSTNGKVWNNISTQSDPLIGRENFYGRGVAFGYDPLGAPLWVATGVYNTLWSSDGKIWNTSYGKPFGLITGEGNGVGYGVAYNGSMWVTVGTSNYEQIHYSLDGTYWEEANGSFGHFGYSVAYDTSGWIAVGDDDDGPIGNNILYSPDGINWAPGPGSNIGTFGYGIASTQPPPVQKSTTPFVIAAGNGMYYSTDGINWVPGINSVLNFSEYSPTKVAYGGGTWIAINMDGQLAWSHGGYNWIDAPGVLGGYGGPFKYGVAYGQDGSGNPLFVAVGKANEDTTILYSPNGRNWTPANGTLYDDGGEFGSSVAFGTDASGSPLWVAVGYGYPSDIFTSVNGIDWTPTDVGGGGFYGYGVAFGYDPLGAPLWVATGYDNTLWSSDGSTWNPSYGHPFGVGADGGGGGYGIAYNGSLWVAVGGDVSDPNTIRYSPDGRTWYDASGTVFEYAGNSVIYDSGWIAVSGDDNFNILHSDDGINWSVQSQFEEPTYGIASTLSTPPKPPTSSSFTDTSGNTYTTSDVSEWDTSAFVALESALIDGSIQTQVQFAAPPLAFLQSSTYAAFLASDNPQMIAYSANPTTNPALCTIIPIHSTNYVANIALFFPVGKTVSIVLTDGVENVILTEDTSGFLCTQLINIFDKIPFGEITKVPVGGTYTVGQYTLMNYGIYGGVVSGEPVEPLQTTTTTTGPETTTTTGPETTTTTGPETTTTTGPETTTTTGPETTTTTGPETTTTTGPETTTTTGPATTTTTVPTTTTAPTTTTTTRPSPPLPCFVKGTRILTPTGYKCVEEIESGDKVLTSDKRIVNVNIYSFTVDDTTEDTAPYNIQAGSIAPGLPFSDLHISGNHAFQDVKGVWQIPRCLATSNNNIQQHSLGEQVVYYHVECPNYMNDHVLAEGLTAESFNHSRQPVVWMKTNTGYARVDPKDHNRIVQLKTEVKKCDVWEFTPPTIVKVAKVGKPLQGQFWKKK